MNKKFKKNIGLVLIIILFLVLFFMNLNPSADLWWDSSVYIGMGKYIYSFGEIGLYEESRPLVWPLILGFFWKIGFDVVFFGKLTVLLFGIGVIILTYYIAINLFEEKIALLSSLLLAFSPTFFLFNSIMFSGIPSTFFLMLGLYLFIKGRYNLAGLLLGISFMTRFFQIIIIIPVYLFLVYLIYKKKLTTNKFLTSILFFMMPLIPYLFLNYILYNNPIHPFLLQAWMTKFTGWIYHQPFSFYFLNLVKENVLILFSILGLIFIFKDEKLNKLIVPFVLILTFIPFNLTQHKELRLLLPILPFLYILTGYGIIKFTNFFSKNKNIILILLILIGIVQVVPNLQLNDYDDNLDPFYSFIQNNGNIKNIWISNPSFIANTDAKADELIYYPLYDTNKILKLQKNLEKANYVLIDTCDIVPCPPWEDSCDKEHDNFIELLNENFNVNYYGTSEDCKHYIFTK